jgi:hypothetical protein
MINDFAVARALHVLALVHWIGGVAMVTTIVLPRARALANAHAALAAFDAFEGPFATQARFSILLAGLSGFYMLNKMQAWTLLLDPPFWWLALMVAVWAVLHWSCSCSSRLSSTAYFTFTRCATRIAPSRWQSGYMRWRSQFLALRSWPGCSAHKAPCREYPSTATHQSHRIRQVDRAELLFVIAN